MQLTVKSVGLFVDLGKQSTCPSQASSLTNMPGPDPAMMDAGSLYKAIEVINNLAVELDADVAFNSVRNCALDLLECERVTLFLLDEHRRELR